MGMAEGCSGSTFYGFSSLLTHRLFLTQKSCKRGKMFIRNCNDNKYAYHL